MQTSFSPRLSFRGVPRQVVTAASLQLFQSVTAESLLAEAERKSRSRFGKSEVEIAHVLKVLRRASVVVDPQERVNICRDPKDNHVLECALAGGADVIVSGDKDLLVLGAFRSIRMVTPRKFLDDLSVSAAPSDLP